MSARFLWSFSAFICLVLVSGCGVNRNYADLPTDVADYTDRVYEIGVGDQLNIMVWRNGELSVSVPVRPDGKISVPLVGDIFAAGKTAPILASELTSELEKYIRSPQVTVIVTNPNSSEFTNRVRITGAVNNPTSIPYRKGMTVLDLVLQAGGVTEFSNPNNAKLYRTTSAGREVHGVYIEDILERGDVRSNYTLMPSDIVTVPERAF